MKVLKIALLSVIALGLVFSFAFAAGDVEKGKALFNDPKFADGTAGKACNSCHPDGKGLEKSAAKKEWMTPAGPAKTLEEAINLCIVNANKGKALDPKSEQMKDIISYIKSLKAPAEMPKKMGY
jgi:cytochrome c553